MFCIECHAYANDFEGVGEEDGGDPRKRAGDEATNRLFVGLVRYHNSPNLFVGQEFYASVREDSQEGSGVASKQSAQPIRLVDVSHGRDHSKPMSCVLCKLGIRSLEKDLDTVEGTDDGFGSTSCKTSGETTAEDIVKTPLVELYLLLESVSWYCYRRVIGCE